MEHSLYLRGVKQCLKSRGITYADLAKQMRMTESGVKKMLNAKDISLRRLLKICDILGVLPGQLFTISENAAVPVVSLTTAQEAALIKDRRLLAAYWLLVIDKREVKEIQAVLRTSESTLKTHFHRLVTLGLLKHRRGIFQPIHLGKFKWSDDSKLAKLLNREWSELTLHRALADKQKQHSLHRLVALKLTDSSYKSLKIKISETLDEAVQTSEREELTMPKDELHNITLLTSCVGRGIFDEATDPNIDDD